MARDRAGFVNRAFLGVKVLEGGPPPAGTKLFREGAEVGLVTSAVQSPRLRAPLALAYIRRGHQDPGLRLEAQTRRGTPPGGGPTVPAGQLSLSRPRLQPRPSGAVRPTRLQHPYCLDNRSHGAPSPRPYPGRPFSCPRHILFVTGKLAEPSLRRVLAELAPPVGFDSQVAVLPITVAALLTTAWIGRKLQIPSGSDRVMLPGYCCGDLTTSRPRKASASSAGPRTSGDLPEFFGGRPGRPESYGAYDIAILAEINHAPRLPRDEICWRWPGATATAAPT